MNCVLSPRPAVTVMMVATLALVGAGCGGGSVPSTAPEPEATPVLVDDVPETGDDLVVAPTEVPTETPVDAPAPEATRYLPELVLDDAAAGPRPLLSWAAVDGAARYTLVVLGADANPYWAWSGPETAIHIGGFDDADAVGPWVHEPMTWTVAATDADGTPIAISEPGALTR